MVVGTDHHPFASVVNWADAWATAHPEVPVMVQYGYSQPPTVAAGVDFLEPDDLAELLSQAQIVVIHGGPGTLTAARNQGHLPVMTPRDPARGEHVDGHQLRFSQWAQQRALVHSATAPADLDEVITDLLATGGTSIGVEPADRTAAVSAFSQLLQSPRQIAPGSPTTLFIGGFGRSGSTLLERFLAQSPTVVALGEVVHLVERGLLADELCGCGKPFSQCSFWNEVAQRAFGGWSQVDVQRLQHLRNLVDRQRRLLSTLRRRTNREFRSNLLEYTDFFRAIYQAAQDVTGATVTVDSSKHASLALALSHNRHVDLRVAQVVRDPRKVAASWSAQVKRPETGDREEYMAQFGAASAAGLWLSNNLLLEQVQRFGVPLVRLRFEDLLSAPQTSLADLWQQLDLPAELQIPWQDDRTVDLAVSHTVAGNPMRFRTGVVTIEPEDQGRPPAAGQWLVHALTAPVARRYGYR